MSLAAEASRLEPVLEIRPAAGDVTAVVLILHGGRANSFEPTKPSQLTAVRMRPFMNAISRRTADRGVAVWMLRYRVRGWNGDDRSPVADAEWALAEIRRRHGDVPVVLVGHSMGGRTAFAVGGDPVVAGICALAPWCEKADPVAQLAKKTVLIAHGSADRVTVPKYSRRYADRAAAAGARVGYLIVRGEMHAMVFRWRWWHRTASGFALAVLGYEPLPRRLQRAFTD
jgi:alpha-beta hydrolase superfamily lysophospholipase